MYKDLLIIIFLKQQFLIGIYTPTNFKEANFLGGHFPGFNCLLSIKILLDKLLQTLSMHRLKFKCFANSQESITLCLINLTVCDLMPKLDSSCTNKRIRRLFYV